MRYFAERSGAKYGRATAGVNRIYCVRRAERSDSGVRVQRGATNGSK
jgi:hypothetical protein